MNNTNLYNEKNQATYCPEDDKIRLYVGRVPREEYLALKAEGWTSTPKQDCDFVATWTTSREDTALSYAGIILDEDQSPQERAADRAERFGEYRDKRRFEAHGYADEYDAGQTVHGYQDYTKAVRAADRHDRLADKACDAWSKAEYWQRRTAGVISHALYKCSPFVRMGRIKEIEADIRKAEKESEEYDKLRKLWVNVAAITDSEKQKRAALCVSNYGGYYNGYYHHPRPESASSYAREHGTSLYSLLSQETDPITGAEAAAMFLSKNPDLNGQESRWLQHQRLRLAYERQMLEAEGGRAGELEMEIGGTFAGGVISKINKSSATGRVVSVAVIVSAVEGWAYKIKNTPGTDFALMQIDVERSSPDSYKAPSPESLAKLEAYKAAVKAAKAEKPKDPPLINPTREDAEKLQEIWNAAKNAEAKRRWEKDPKNYRSEVAELTQKQYQAISGGTFSQAETIWIGSDGFPTYEQYRGNVKRGAVCKIRKQKGEYPHASRVIVLTDKPQKPLPAFSPKAVEVKA